MSPAVGAVTALAFYAPSTGSGQGSEATHLLSAASDGSVSVWASQPSWECLKALKGHRGEVTGLSMHPSGRIGLTCGRDSTVRLWNLVKGKCAHERRYKTTFIALHETSTMATAC